VSKVSRERKWKRTGSSGGSVEDGEVVAVDDFVAAAVRVACFHVRAFESGEARNFGSGVSGLSACDECAVGRDDVDDVARFKLAAGMGDADGEQATALVAEHRHRAVVDVNRAGGPGSGAASVSWLRGSGRWVRKMCPGLRREAAVQRCRARPRWR